MFTPKLNDRDIGAEFNSTLGVPVEFLLVEISGSNPVYLVNTKAFNAAA